MPPCLIYFYFFISSVSLTLHRYGKENLFDDHFERKQEHFAACFIGWKFRKIYHTDFIPRCMRCANIVDENQVWNQRMTFKAMIRLSKASSTHYVGWIQKWRFHSEKASKLFRPHENETLAFARGPKNFHVECNQGETFYCPSVTSIHWPKLFFLFLIFHKLKI